MLQACHYVPCLHGGGHIVFGANHVSIGVGVGIGITVSCLHNIL